MMAVKEASEALPALQEKLDGSIKQAEDMQKAMERSFDALQNVYVAGVQARGLAHSGGLPMAGAKPDVVQRLIALSPLSQQNRSALAWRPDVYVDNLGGNREAPGVDIQDGESAESIRRRAVTAVMGAKWTDGRCDEYVAGLFDICVMEKREAPPTPMLPAGRPRRH